MSKTPLTERMTKGGAAKTWIKEVEAKDREIDALSQKIVEHLNIIDNLANEREQLEAENAKLKRVTKGMDLQGLKSIATELAKREKPFSFPSLWRDTGTRQRRIGEQLLRLIDALLTEQE